MTAIRKPPFATRGHRAAAVALAVAGWWMVAAPLSAQELPHLTVKAEASRAMAAYEGTVEAVRQAVLAAQVPGAVLELTVKAGDRVRAGQTLVRIDGRAAEQGAAASQAQVTAARAALDVAAAELARKRQLYDKHYIAKAALEQAEAAQRAAQAQVNALQAQAGAARAQTTFHVVTAPFDGVVSAVSVERGSMAMPGSPLLSLYDPAALRVTAAVPSAVVSGGVAGVQVELERVKGPITPTRVQLLPTVDPASLTQLLRAELPAGMTGVAPGLFARLWLPGPAAAEGTPQRVFVPRTALVQRAEMTGLYVLGEQGQPLLRQVRLGRVQGEQVEVLAGLSAGEKVVTEPQAAVRRAPAGR